jgi:hypothetical protein
LDHVGRDGVLADGGEGDEWGEGRGGFEFEEEGRKRGPRGGRAAAAAEESIDRSAKDARDPLGKDWIGLGWVGGSEKGERRPLALGGLFFSNGFETRGHLSS